MHCVLQKKREEFTEHLTDLYNFLEIKTFFCRNCIGQAFAQSEEKVLLARIMNRYGYIIIVLKCTTFSAN